MAIHIVNTALRDVTPDGTVIIDKAATIGEVITSSKEFRVIPDVGHAPNSDNHPTVKTYLIAEDSAAYKLIYMDQHTIITQTVQAAQQSNE